MSETIIQAETLGKRYRLGVINRGMLYKDIQSWWARVRGREDPNTPVHLAGKRGSITGETFWAFRDVSFSVNRGEILGIIGRNGAGKSTLLKVLSQITAPSEGVFKLKGRVASLLEVGTGFHGELTGRENIYLNGAILGMSRIEVRSKFDEIVDFAEVSQFIDTPVKRYSSGMYVRLAFSVAAHLQPDILIVDEVLAVGDAAFQQKCLGRMDEAAFKEGRTILFVSHNMASVRQLCTRVLMLKNGRVAMDGKPGPTVDHYLDEGALAASDGETTRAGSGRLRITSVHFENDHQGRTSELVTGQGCSIVLEFGNSNLRATDRVSVGVSVHGAGNDVFCHYSHFSGSHFSDLPARGSFRFLWPSVDVIPGHYNIGIRVVANGDEHTGELLDIPPPIFIPVCASDFYGSGRNDGMNFGTILVRGKWTLT